MFVLSPLLSLVFVVFVPVFAWSPIRFRDRVFPASWNDQRLSGAVAGVVDEAVTGVRVVKAFAQEDREFARLIGPRARAVPVAHAHGPLQLRATPRRCRLLPMLGQLGVLGVGGWLALDGHITLGVFLAFASYLVQIITPVRLLSGMLATTQQARAGAERVFELLDTAATRRPTRPTPGRSSTRSGAVEFDDVSVRLRRRGRRRCTTSR